MKTPTLIGKKIEIERPTWAETYLMMSVMAAMRSEDAETKCGCIITSSDNTVLSAGYNGYVRGYNTDLLPNTRPDKYPFFIHSELNAILNCARNGAPTKGAIAYISGPPCNHCFQSLLQAGIDKIWYTNWSKPKMVDDEQASLVRETIKQVYNWEDKVFFIPFFNVAKAFNLANI